MSKPDSYALLSRVLRTVYRSLPMYLKWACPWTHLGDEQTLDTLHRIVENQTEFTTRLADYIIDHYGPVDAGDYPLDFPDTHDLAFDYLVTKLVVCQKRDVKKLEACAAELQGDRAAAAFAEEALGAARGHLETLEELAARLKEHGVGWAKT
jgi:hypothetical protein